MIWWCPFSSFFLIYIPLPFPQDHRQLGQNCMQLVGKGLWILRKSPMILSAHSFYKGRTKVNRPSCDNHLKARAADPAGGNQAWRIVLWYSQDQIEQHSPTALCPFLLGMACRLLTLSLKGHHLEKWQSFDNIQMVVRMILRQWFLIKSVEILYVGITSNPHPQWWCYGIVSQRTD